MDRWPSEDLVLFAQLVHDPPMIDLGGEFVLHLWHWADPDCFMDPPGYEVNSLFSTVLRRDEIGSGLSDVSKDKVMLGEVFVEGWEVLDDGVPAAWGPSYRSKDKYLDLLDRETEEVKTGGGLRTRFGGFPCWGGTEGIHGLPEGVTFLFQTDGSYRSNKSLSEFSRAGAVLHDESGSIIGTRSKPNAPESISEYKGEVVVRFANFASDGIAFVFLDKSSEIPTARWTWSR